MKTKTLIKLTGVAIAGLLMLTGCGNNPQPNIKLTNQCIIDGAKAPKWVCNNVDNNTTIYASGSAEKSPLGFHFEQTEAMANARDRLSRRLSLKVENMLKKYYSSTGTGKAQTGERVVTDVSKQLSKNTINGSKLITTWVSPKGTVFVLIGIDRNAAINGVKSAVKTTFHNDKALWQEFKAKKAQEELDAQIDKEFNNQ